MARTIDWGDGTWTTDPASSRRAGNSLVVEAVAGSDFWERTLYGFEHRNGHALLAPWIEGMAVEVTFRLSGFTALYDQAGLMVWTNETTWIKAGVEINDEVPHLASVVTNGVSDWSLAPIADWVDHDVTIRASRLANAVVLRARAGDQPWRTVRVAPFDPGSSTRAGPYLCAPSRSGFVTRFIHWLEADRDTGLHASPALR